MDCYGSMDTNLTCWALGHLNTRNMDLVKQQDNLAGLY